MLKIFRYLKKAYIPIACIVLLLCVQVSCELTIPTYTSNIVNVGIQQGGIEDAVPDAVREESMKALMGMMKPKDAEKVKDAYELYSRKQVKDSDYSSYKKGRLYVRKDISKKEREDLDIILSKPMLMLEMKMMEQSGQTKENARMAQKFKGKSIDDMPESIISQAAISFVKAEYKAMGLDLDQIQTNYMLRTGAIMVGLALLAMAVSVTVVLLSAKLAARLTIFLKKSWILRTQSLISFPRRP